MSRIGILCTCDEALDLLMKQCLDLGRDRKGLYTAYRGTLAGHGLAMICSGPGKINAALAAQYLIDRFSVESVIMFGTAAGVSDAVKALDTVVCTESVFSDTDPAIYEQYPKLETPVFPADEQLLAFARKAADSAGLPVHFGRISTGDTAPEVCDADALCTDSGTAAAAHACLLNGVPFIAIRTITTGQPDAEPGCAVRAAHLTAELVTVISNN